MTDLDMTQARKRSVTSGDVERVPAGVIPLTVLLGPIGLLDQVPGLAQHGQFGLPAEGSRARDRLLAQSHAYETMWSAALFKAISKKVAQGFRMEDADDSASRLKRAQKLILGYDGNYTTGLQRGLRDYLTTDLGMVVEIARASNARGARVVGLFHLDSLRCWPTGDTARPLVYEDRAGGLHLLRDEDVLRITDLPSPRVELRGVGMCASSRAWNAILKLAAVEVYFREKITGTRNLAIHIVNGISEMQLSGALATGAADAQARGYVIYRGSTIIPTLKSDAASVVTIPLAEVPDGFDVGEERRDAYKRYAHSIGMNVDEFVERPAGLNSGLGAAIADEAASGQGMAMFDKQFEHAISHKVLPGSTTFYMSGDDWRGQKLEAEARKARADTLAVYVQMGALRADQALNVAVDAGDIDKAFLPNDATDAGAIDDTEKLIRGEGAPAPAPAVVPAVPPQQVPA